MRSGNKSDLISCIEKIPNASPTVESPKVPVAVLEGSLLVNLVKPKKNRTSYASEEFKSQVAKHQREYSSERIYIIFDRYRQITPKRATREFVEGSKIIRLPPPIDTDF